MWLSGFEILPCDAWYCREERVAGHPARACHFAPLMLHCYSQKNSPLSLYYQLGDVARTQGWKWPCETPFYMDFTRAEAAVVAGQGIERVASRCGRYTVFAACRLFCHKGAQSPGST